MKKIKNLFSNTLTLILLLILGVVLALFLSSRSENDQPVAQATQTKVTIAPTTEVKATPLPTTTATATLAPSTQPAEPPKDDTPEPTWTPVIIFPVGTPPPLPSPPPTPTATPVNPNESEIAAFDVPVGGLAISPDDQTLAIVPSLKFLPEQGGNIVNQLWMVDLNSIKVEKLDVYGRRPVWSPDGQHILFEARSDDQVQIKIITKDGKDEIILTSLPWSDLLGYYWSTSDQVDVIKPDSINRLDLTGKAVDRVSIALPAKSKSTDIKPQVVGHPNGFVVVADGQNLLVVKYDGQTTTISDVKGRQISSLFSLSPDGKQLAYVVNDGATNDELWFTDLADKTPMQLYLVERGHIVSLTWTPDSQAIVVGWKETGTTLGDELTLLLFDVKSNQAIPLEVDNVDRGFIFSHSGDRLFYGRAFYPDPTSEGQTTLYQLRIKR